MAKREKNFWIKLLWVPALLLSIMWLAEILKWAGYADFSWLGIHPREANGLPGIFFAPLLHANFGHLVSNSSPFFFLLTALFYFYPSVVWKTVGWSWAMTGIWVWVAGSNGNHIGASGLVYAFASFLFFSSILRRDKGLWALALLIVMMYGSLVWGLMPGLKGISWESHLFGAIAGLILAFVFRKEDVPEKKKYSWEIEPEPDDDDENAHWNYKNEVIILKDDEED